MKTAIFYCALLATGLLGCGGSSVSPTSNTPGAPSAPAVDITPKKSVNGLHFYYPDNFYQGQAASFAVQQDTNTTLSNIEWRQTSGAPLKFLAPHTQVIAFDIEQSGDYQITFNGTTSNNQTITETFSFTALNQTNGNTSIRLDHAVSQQASVSLRVATQENKTITGVSWAQLDGPKIAEFEKQENDVFFTAPTVSKDEIIQISAQVNYSDGSVESDTSLLVVKPTSINQDGYFPKFAENIVSTDVFPYVKGGPHEAGLKQCVYNNQVSQSCDFNTLPLIGQEHAAPSVQDILNRLVVSHPWMGQRFEQFLQQSSTSEDMLKLLRATTAIVISYDIRPSFYWTATGAIYLDAANFWVTPQERDTLNTQPDYRSNFGDDLRFFIPWRYVKNNDYYYRASDYPSELRLTKTFRDLEANVAWLMYHELGHANDFFPPSSWNNISLQTSPLAHANINDAASISFSETYPLHSSVLLGTAKVSFAGETATSEQKALTAVNIADEFKPDNAVAYYSYSTIREDYATLFERFMMAYRLGVSADVAVISQINNDDLIVTWGQRDRVNATQIQPRVRAVVRNILPELDVSAIQNTLPTPKLLRANQDWFSNINLDSISPMSAHSKPEKVVKPNKIEDYWHTYRHGPSSP